MTVNVERIFFLHVSKIKAAYTHSEMKDEFKFLNTELENRNIAPVKKDNRLYKTYTKDAYASCISEARLKLLDVDKNWIEKRKTDIWEENDMKRMSKERLFQGKVESELGKKFFSLKGTQKYDECNVSLDDSHCFFFNFKATSENNSTEHDANQNQLVFESDDENDDNSRAAVTRNRESIGGTCLMDCLFSP